MTQINETAVTFQWIPIDGTYLYAVYYFSYLCSGSMTFSNNTNHHVLLVQGTAPLFIDLYNFTISIKVKIRGTLYEGETNSPILKGINNEILYYFNFSYNMPIIKQTKYH